MKKLICMLLCVMLILSLTACGEQAPAQETQPTAAAQTQPAESQTEAAEEPTQPRSDVLEDSVPVANFEVETPYCMLLYPMTWQGYVAVEQAQQKDAHVVSFLCTLEGRENIPVFDVIFGGEAGDLVGHLETEAGSLPVYFRTYPISDNADLNQDEADMLLAMMEDINVVYTGLTALENFG